jgi:hypothetical protein
MKFFPADVKNNFRINNVIYIILNGLKIITAKNPCINKVK